MEQFVKSKRRVAEFGEVLTARLRTNVHGAKSPKGLEKAVKFYGSQHISWIERSAVAKNPEWIDKWEVLMTRLQGTSAAVESMVRPMEVADE